MPIRADTVLVVHADRIARGRLSSLLENDGRLAIEAADAEEARARIMEAPPHLMVLDAAEPASALALLSWLRDLPGGDSVGVTVVVDPDDRAAMLRAFDLGADDVVEQGIDPLVLGARLRARLERPPLPRSRLQHDPVTGALTSEAFQQNLRLEVERTSRGGTPGCLAYLSLHELPHLEAEHGPRARDEILAQVVALIEEDGRSLDLIGFSRQHAALLLPGTPAKGAQCRLERLSKRLYEHEFTLGGQAGVRLTPAFGFCANEAGLAVEELEDRSWSALMHEAEQLDLHPTRWRREMSKQSDRPDGNVLRRHRTGLQIAFQQLLCLGLPLGLYLGLDRLGADVTGTVYLLVVVGLAFTSLAIWVECLAAVRKRNPPRRVRGSYPPATAVIAAYLPNEAETILETVEAFLGHDYPDLQVILAYNAPGELEVERVLKRIAEEDPRFLPLRVEGSVSKAQNVNAAISRVTGELVGLFDADHHPAPGSFRRAWRWLQGGADVVQGHCVVRNGHKSALTALVAAEFEAIYAVSHPGRARLHGFGIFGGSNGFWRTSLLERVRLRGFMLTEDIDSSLRVLAGGGKIVSDPRLVSTELAPEHWGALWNQRMRWAQGWSQVSLKHLGRSLRSRSLSVRQRLGVLYLLGWREAYPWLSLQTFPILFYWLLRGEPPVEWFVPVFVATTIFTFSSGVAQAVAAWRLGHPSVREHGRWFLLFMVASQVFYTELKNVMQRTAHIKEATGERKWKVTPRTLPQRPVFPEATPAITMADAARLDELAERAALRS